MFTPSEKQSCATPRPTGQPRRRFATFVRVKADGRSHDPSPRDEEDQGKIGEGWSAKRLIVSME